MIPIRTSLPDDFLNEEIRCGFTVTSRMKKVWAVEIDILFQIMDVCKRHSIKFFVVGGTLLGAVRHSGFIPWDNDIDVAMLRDDYEKFGFWASKELEYPYFLQNHHTDPHCCHGHIQVRNSLTTGVLSRERGLGMKYNQGLFVDVFPYDNFPDNLSEGEKWVNDSLHFKRMAYKKLLSLYYPKYFAGHSRALRHILPFAHKLKESILLCVSGRSFSDYMDLFEQSLVKYRYSDTKSVSCTTLSYSPGKVWPAVWFDETVNLKFEWFDVPAPSQYVRYLDALYGDWRQYKMDASCHGELTADPEHPYSAVTQSLK